MAFNSLTFIIYFPLLLVAYAVTPDRYKRGILLIFSLIFYAASGLEKLVFLLLTSLVIYAAARKMGNIYQEEELARANKNTPPRVIEGQSRVLQSKKQCRRVLLAALFVCLGILCYCKYAKTFFSVLTRLTGLSLSIPIIVPLGISYYTFSSVGYLLDIYWRKAKPETSYWKLLLCMVYFPQIVQGPISRYQKLLPQFNTLKRPDYQRLCMGLQLMLWGYFKKMVVADRLAIFVDDVFGNIAGNEGFTFVIALFFAVFQLYADFSGCMDIVTGISDILGIQLDRNFAHPFFSRSIAEFWRRWHITLGTWFKDYVYLPLATSPRTIAISKRVKGKYGTQAGKTVTTIICLGTVWLLTGIWHGTGMNYIAWGIYYGGLISCSTIFAKQYKKLAQRFHIDTESDGWKHFQVVRTFCLFAIGRLITVPGTLRGSALALRQMFSSCNLWIFWDQSLYSHGLNRANFLVALLSILLLLYVDKRQEKGNIREAIERKNIVMRWGIYYLGIFAVLILGIYGPGYDASSFVYANF